MAENWQSFCIKMPYIGACLSVNHCYIRTPTGRRVLKRETRVWMNALVSEIRRFMGDHRWIVRTPMIISIKGCYQNRKKALDGDNVLKVVWDAVSAATGINDREFRYESVEPSFGVTEPELWITIRSPYKEET